MHHWSGIVLSTQRPLGLSLLEWYWFTLGVEPNYFRRERPKALWLHDWNAAKNLPSVSSHNGAAIETAFCSYIRLEGILVLSGLRIFIASIASLSKLDSQVVQISNASTSKTITVLSNQGPLGLSLLKGWSYDRSISSFVSFRRVRPKVLWLLNWIAAKTL